MLGIFKEKRKGSAFAFYICGNPCIINNEKKGSLSPRGGKNGCTANGSLYTSN
ncbi:hypothetical protein HMPREF1986_01826 [Oribacterium sp. oral taxon 078 str. F0263]|nr:hypothetical protein GCWU000341_00153 [Oribacterium sp. oral taxon 078 str. F0262]ERL20902.1 hypothetical protein HMPREF1986_01826 [Oribacterium sp. oral taxon 078 str. F0263]